MIDKAKIVKGLRRLAELDRGLELFGSGTHCYELARPVSDEQLGAFESRHHVSLPEEYRVFMTELGNGGAGPGYGLNALGYQDSGFEYVPWERSPGLVGDLSKPFPHRAAWNELPDVEDEPDPEDFSDERAYQAALDAYDDDACDARDEQYFDPAIMNGAIPIVHHGCAIRDWLVVNGPLAGQVWCDQRCDDVGVYPLTTVDGTPLTFGAWYMQWLDERLAEAEQRSARGELADRTWQRWLESARSHGRYGNEAKAATFARRALDAAERSADRAGRALSHLELYGSLARLGSKAEAKGHIENVERLVGAGVSAEDRLELMEACHELADRAWNEERLAPDDPLLACWRAMEREGDTPDLLIEALWAHRFGALSRRGLGGLEIYRQTAERFGRYRDPRVRIEVAELRRQMALRLKALNRLNDAIESLEAAVSDIDGLPDSDDTIVPATFDRAFIQAKAGETDAAIETCRTLQERLYQHENDSYFEGWLVKTTRYLGKLLVSRQRLDEARAAFDEAWSRGADSGLELSHRVDAVQARIICAEMVRDQGRVEEALALLRDVTERTGMGPAPLWKSALPALSLQLQLLETLGRLDEADALCERVVEVSGDDGNPESVEELADLLANRVVRCYQAGDADGGARELQQLWSLYAPYKQDAVRGHVAWGVVEAACQLERRGHVDVALALYRRLPEVMGGDPSTEVRVQVAWSLVYRAEALRGRGELEAATEIYAELRSRFDPDDEAENIRAAWGAALHGLAAIALERSDLAAAQDLLDELDHRYGEAETENVRLEQVLARETRGRLLRAQGRRDEAVALDEDTLERFADLCEDDRDAAAFVAISKRLEDTSG